MTKILPDLVVLVTFKVLAQGTAQAHSMPGNGSETHGSSALRCEPSKDLVLNPHTGYCVNRDEVPPGICLCAPSRNATLITSAK